MSTENFLTTIQEYCRAKPMAKSALGREVLGDPGFVTRLEGGAQCQLRTYEKVMRFMAQNPPPIADAATVSPSEDAA